MSRAAKQPTLPQNVDPRDQQKRVAQLADACKSYVWTTTVASLPGVPLAAEVPFSDKPTIEWLRLVAQVGLAIARNVIAVKLSGAGKTQAAPAAALALGPEYAPEDETASLARDAQRCDEIEAFVAKLASPPPVPGMGGLLEDVKAGIQDVERGSRARQASSRSSACVPTSTSCTAS